MGFVGDMSDNKLLVEYTGEHCCGERSSEELRRINAITVYLVRCELLEEREGSDEV